MIGTPPSDSSDSELRPKVFLVDDDEVTLMLISTALTQFGFDISLCSNSDEALETLSGWTPDVIVLDAIMPGRDGFDTCRALRKMPGFEHLPVMMLTGLDDEASITRAYDVGADDFFVKSNQWSLLARRLRYLLRAAGTRIELERSKAKLARAQDLARMGSFDWWYGTGKSVVSGLDLSEEGLRVFGFGPEDKVGLRTMLRLITPAERRSKLRTARQILRQVSVLAFDVPMSLPDSRYRIIHVEAEPEFGEHGHCVGYTGIVQDVTERRVAEDQVFKLANFDSLTSLPNRRQLKSRIERALEFARRMGHQVALLLIDLDRFKNINDTLGHTAGDDLLIEVSSRLRSCVRHSDQLFDGVIEAAGSRTHRSLEAVGRLGGDEFVALLPEVSDEREAEQVAQRILEALRQPFIVGGQECFAKASIGIALFPRDGTTAEDLLRNSDVAMYATKTQGRDGSTLYAAHLAAPGRERLALETDLHKALERGELVLHYQPQVDVQSGRLAGIEALMRWQRGERLVPPGEFIPLAEETGLIVPLSEWALHEAARQASVWQREFGFSGAVSVNMPYRMFERSDLVEQIDLAVHEHGIAYSMLQLEITETELMTERQSIVPTLERLNAAGVQISIDDFGTGYSQFSRLSSLPISELKIDSSFVQNLGLTPKSALIVSAILALARALDLRVIAEGVETQRQQEVLYSLGCTLMQGFLFARPMPGEALQGWLEQTMMDRKPRPTRPASRSSGLVSDDATLADPAS